MFTKHTVFIFQTALILLFAVNIAVWSYARDKQAVWLNVPPPPTYETIKSITLGDTQFGYRTIGYMLQNVGDFGGKNTSLRDYDYEALGKWFWLSDKIDPQAHYVPFLAAYYFGASRDKDDLSYIIDYLVEVGQRPGRWRWLVQAFYIALRKQEDPDRAIEIAELLENHIDPRRPEWSYRLRALTLSKIGEKETAYILMRQLVQKGYKTMHPNEINYMIGYICKDLAEFSKDDPLCNRYRNRP